MTMSVHVRRKSMEITSIIQQKGKLVANFAAEEKEAKSNHESHRNEHNAADRSQTPNGTKNER